ncbi:MAG: RDD family protein [Flavobacteriales bacterium]|nr:RDD family protein [Flavobacteriales bacterium]
MSSAPATTQSTVHFAGLGRRAASAMIDAALLMSLASLPKLVGLDLRAAIADPRISMPGAVGLLAALLLVAWAYSACFECSRLQATPGKLALDLRVTDPLGRRLDFLGATARFHAKLLTLLTLGSGLLLIAFTRRKQALHDLLSASFVLHH